MRWVPTHWLGYAIIWRPLAARWLGRQGYPRKSADRPAASGLLTMEEQVAPETVHLGKFTAYNTPRTES